MVKVEKGRGLSPTPSLDLYAIPMISIATLPQQQQEWCRRAGLSERGFCLGAVNQEETIDLCSPPPAPSTALDVETSPHLMQRPVSSGSPVYTHTFTQ
ncbi:hypothetical protein ROHU_021093 [Labeo rohita]|uniref:Uncharacterized protein n=1 Tax=Labeo rohita TaxID=84645 RepID=A0A498MVS3_LABRO|nr:hypothetical protein ROHU_021093 [Labeo rohita]